MIIFCIIFGVLSVILGFWVGAHADKISRLLCGGFANKHSPYRLS